MRLGLARFPPEGAAEGQKVEELYRLRLGCERKRYLGLAQCLVYLSNLDFVHLYLPFVGAVPRGWGYLIFPSCLFPGRRKVCRREYFPLSAHSLFQFARWRFNYHAHAREFNVHRFYFILSGASFQPT